MINHAASSKVLYARGSSVRLNDQNITIRSPQGEGTSSKTYWTCSKYRDEAILSLELLQTIRQM